MKEITKQAVDNSKVDTDSGLSSDEDDSFNLFKSKNNNITKKNNDRLNIKENENIEKMNSKEMKNSIVNYIKDEKETKIYNFNELGLNKKLCSTLTGLNITEPTAVQRFCIPEIMKGKNIIACSETGSGKTAAFLLPILQTLLKEPYGVFCIIITPTRELAMQIAEQAQVLGSSTNTRTALIIGGESVVKQQAILTKRPNIIICTPGRLLAHLEAPNPPFVKRLRFLVFDEADRLCNLDFEPILTKILSKLNNIQGKWIKERQLLLFSATVRNEIDKLRVLINKNKKEYFEFHLNKEETTNNNLDERYILCPKQIKFCYFIYLMKLLCPEEIIKQTALKESTLTLNKKRKRPKDVIFIKQTEQEEEEEVKEIEKVVENRIIQTKRAKQIIIFVSTKEMNELVAECLHQLRFSHDILVSLSSNMDQPRRNAALGKFRSGIAKILVATDVASRGLDIPKVDLVINFDFPRTAELYVHRCGRTARAGNIGRVISIVTETDIKRNKVDLVENYTKKKLLILENVSEDEALLLLTRSSNAMNKAKMEIEMRKLKQF